MRFDLINNTYQSHRKLNSETVYINKKSNHPRSMSKELPQVINQGITNISCNQDIFDAGNNTCVQAPHNSAEAAFHSCFHKKVF